MYDFSPCSVKSRPFSSSSFETLNSIPAFLRINAIKRVPIAERQYAIIMAWNCPKTKLILPFSNKICPAGWEEIKSYRAKMPVRRAPTVPPTPWTANVSRESSNFNYEKLVPHWMIVIFTLTFTSDQCYLKKYVHPSYLGRMKWK